MHADVLIHERALMSVTHLRCTLPSTDVHSCLSTLTVNIRDRMMSNEFNIIAVACAVIVKQKAKNKKGRKRWCKPWLLERKQLSHINLLEQLRLEPDD